MPRPEELFLRDIVRMADELDEVIAGLDIDIVARHDTLRSAALLKLIIIGEAAAHVGNELRTRHPDIPWHRIVGFRNLTIHQYFGIDWDIVCAAAFDDVPVLKRQIEAVLNADFPKT